MIWYGWAFAALSCGLNAAIAILQDRGPYCALGWTVAGINAAAVAFVMHAGAL